MGASDNNKKKVAILGGGVGGITTAFALTAPELAGKYDVTIYQMGWRLGGKGASGRDADASQRIEEHGLHIWMGFYHNAFVNMKACYDELGRDPKAPLGTFDAAFKPQSTGTLMDLVKGEWSRWDIPMPITTDPLIGGDHPSVLGHLEMLVQWMVDILASTFWRDVMESGLFRAIVHAVEWVIGGSETVMHDALHAIRAHKRGEITADEVHARVVRGARHLGKTVRSGYERDDSVPHDVMRVMQVMDIGCAALVGLFEKGVVTRGVPFAALDDMELKEFLAAHGCHKDSLASPLLRGYYDLAFAFRHSTAGVRNEATAAGTSLLAILRVCFEYRGAFMWRMQAGMGDTIFGPYYEVLKRRGVKFKFFHTVTALEAGKDPAGNPRVLRVRISRQVDIRPDAGGGTGEYDPLVDVAGLPSWPSVPRFEQIVQGDALKNGPDGQPYDLESRWSGWKDVGEAPPLEAGKDFDHLVLAIPVGAHRLICADLIAKDAKWATMVDKVETAQTFGVQIWLDRGMEEMGWKIPVREDEPQRAVVDAFADPLNSFADNTHLLSIEQWKGPVVPKSLLYFCGVLPDEYPKGEFPPPTDTAFPGREYDRVRAMSVEWLRRNTGAMLPKAADAKGCLDWSLLVDPDNRAGEARFDAQFWRANIDPSERYVLSVPGSTAARLKAGDSQFDNLALAGDWTNTGFSVGCVEAATMSGLQAARAISDGTHHVYGEMTQEAKNLGAAASTPRGLPPYITSSDSEDMLPPYAFRRLSIRSFPLLADAAKLQKMVDRLNLAPPEVLEFRAIGNVAYMQVAQYPYLASLDETEGWFTENEVSFNLLVARGKRVNGTFVPIDLGYFFAYIFVDNPWAIATGREVFGYPKAESSFTFGKGDDNLVVKLDTWAFKTESPKEKLRKVPLIKIVETERLHGISGGIAEAVGVAAELGDLLFGPAGLVDQASVGLVRGFVDMFAKQQIGIFSLKQFRDAAEPKRACYQAIVKAEFDIRKWHSCALLPGKFAATILTEASVPIVAQLGLQVDAQGRIETMQPFAMEFDCIVTPGQNLFVNS